MATRPGDTCRATPSPPLVEAGYRVIVPDLLGAGRPDKPDRPEVYTVRRHAERTEQLRRRRPHSCSARSAAAGTNVPLSATTPPLLPTCSPPPVPSSAWATSTTPP